MRIVMETQILKQILLNNTKENNKCVFFLFS